MVLEGRTGFLFLCCSCDPHTPRSFLGSNFWSSSHRPSRTPCNYGLIERQVCASSLPSREQAHKDRPELPDRVWNNTKTLNHTFLFFFCLFTSLLSVCQCERWGDSTREPWISSAWTFSVRGQLLLRILRRVCSMQWNKLLCVFVLITLQEVFWMLLKADVPWRQHIYLMKIWGFCMIGFLPFSMFLCRCLKKTFIMQ